MEKKTVVLPLAAVLLLVLILFRFGDGVDLEIAKEIYSARDNEVVLDLKMAKENYSANDNKIVVEVFHNGQIEADVEVVAVEEITTVGLLASAIDIVSGRDSYQIILKQGGKFKPGKYTIKVGDEEVSFLWGVLVMNIYKDIYKPGETVQIGMGVLDDEGRTICDANLYLQISFATGSKFKPYKTLSTENSQIHYSDECGARSITNIPDYFADFKADKAGTYKLKLTAETKNGVRTIEEEIDVREYTPFEIHREGPTRIYPPAPYEMKIRIIANRDFSGVVKEIVPSSFEISGDLEWEVDLEKGEEITFSYIFDAPDVSPAIFFLGKLQFQNLKYKTIFEESRQWQIASDAVITWDGGGGSNTKWDTCTNWTGNTCPGTSDVATFNATSTTNTTVNINVDVAGIDIQSDYTSTITATSTNVTVGSSNFSMAAGNIDFGSGTIDINGDFTLSGGTATSTSGTLKVSGAFNRSGGTFIHNSGTVLLDGSTSQTLTNTQSFNDLMINHGLVGHWRFDEGTGTTANDSSGYGNTGTLKNMDAADWVGGTASTTFANPYALDFDGSNDYIEISDSSSYNFGVGEFSILMWFKKIGEGRGDIFNWKNEGGSNDDFGFILQDDETMDIFFKIDGVGGFVIQNGNSFTINQWHHAVFVRDNNDNVTTYIDGSTDGTGTSNANIDNIDTGTPIWIGSNKSGGSPTLAYNGLIDDVRIYNRALSATEISNLAAGADGAIPGLVYTLSAALDVNDDLFISEGTLDLAGFNLDLTNATFTNNGILRLQGGETLTAFTNDTDSGLVMYDGTANRPSGLITGNNYNSLLINDGLVGYWKFDEGYGISTLDFSGYGNTGTLTNMDPATDWVTTVPTVNFNNPYALDFDGSNDYVDVGGAIATSMPFTMTTWAKFNVVNVDQNPITIADESSTSQQLGFGVNGTSNKFRIWTFNSSFIEGEGSTVSANTWYYLTAVYRSNTDRELFVNGLSDATLNTSQSFPTGLDNTNIGRNGDSTPSGYMDGQIDDVRIYNRALSSTEISSLGAGSFPATASSTYTLAGNLDVNGDFTLTSGGLNASSTQNYSINIAGGWRNYGGVFTPNANTVTFDATSATSTILSGGYQPFNNLTFSGSGGGWLLDDRLYTSSTLAISNGTLDVSTNNYVIHAGNINQTGGALTPRSGTVVIDASNSKTSTTTSAFNNLRIEDPSENGLVGYWKFDEGQGLTAYDSSGQGNDGTLTNDPKWNATTTLTTIKFDNAYALDFDGTNDYVRVSDHNSLDLTTGLTESAWVKADSAISTGNHRIISKGGGSETRYNLRISGNNAQIELKIGGTFFNAKGTSSIADDTWYHLVGTYDESTIRIYIDGVEENSTAQSGSIDTNNLDLMIGACTTEASFCGGFEGFQGPIDDVRIYNRALTAGEVSNLANGRYADGGSGTATFTLGGSLDVNGNLTLDSGLLDVSASNYGITLAGDWTNYSSSTAFTARSGTVTLDGTSQTVTATTSFNNLTKTVTSADTLTFSATDTQTIAGTLTLQGASGNLLSLRSSSDGTQWKINPQGTKTVSFLDIKDSNNINATAVSCSDNCTDSGNNTNWSFAVVGGGGGSAAASSGGGSGETGGGATGGGGSEGSGGGSGETGGGAGGGGGSSFLSPLWFLANFGGLLNGVWDLLRNLFVTPLLF